VEEID